MGVGSRTGAALVAAMAVTHPARAPLADRVATAAPAVVKAGPADVGPAAAGKRPPAVAVAASTPLPPPPGVPPVRVPDRSVTFVPGLIVLTPAADARGTGATDPTAIDPVAAATSAGAVPATPIVLGAGFPTGADAPAASTAPTLDPVVDPILDAGRPPFAAQPPSLTAVPPPTGSFGAVPPGFNVTAGVPEPTALAVVAVPLSLGTGRRRRRPRR